MKTFLFIFIFALSLNADFVLKGRCVKSFSFPSSANIEVVFSDSPQYISTNAFTGDALNQLLISRDLFTYDSNTQQCTLLTTTNNKVLISSLTGILIGFTILFFAIFITIKVGSKK